MLRNRAIADTGTGGLFNTTTPLIYAWNWNAVPEGTQYPYVVQSIGSLVSDNAFAKDIIACTIRFGIWHERSSNIDPTPYTTVSNIEARIYGNWSSASPSTAPTYGFHRFAPSLTGWTATPMQYVTTFDESDGDIIHLIQEFKFWFSA